MRIKARDVARIGEVPPVDRRKESPAEGDGRSDAAEGSHPHTVVVPPLGPLRSLVFVSLILVLTVAAILHLWNPDRWNGVDGMSLLYIGLVLLAVCLPQIDALLRRFKTLKVGTEGSPSNNSRR